MNKLKKHKNKIFVGCGIMVALFVCYLIGQKIVLPNRMEKAGLLTVDGTVAKYSIMEHFNEFQIEGQQEADVPGSLNISLLTLNTENSDFSEEFLGTSIFMLPGTSISNTMKIHRNYQEVTFLCGMAPNISKDVSDGAEVVIAAYEADGKKPIWEEAVEVLPEQGMNVARVSLNPIQGKKIKLVISCSAGKDGTEDGDWVMVKSLSIQ